MSRALHLRIIGRVQGVGFRAWVDATARSLGLDGWVRNTRDGSVEALISGDAAAVEQMLELCREGPPAARVSRIDSQPAQDVPDGGFRVLPTV